jgi:hypothetical protein
MYGGYVVSPINLLAQALVHEPTDAELFGAYRTKHAV